MPDLSELLARVEGATGADREIDALFYCWRYRSAYPDETEAQHLEYARNASPPYTASVDAVLALIERELPGWVVQMETANTLMEEGAWASMNPQQQPFPAHLDVSGSGETLPLALLAAFLRAKMALS